MLFFSKVSLCLNFREFKIARSLRVRHNAESVSSVVIDSPRFPHSIDLLHRSNSALLEAVGLSGSYGLKDMI